MIITHRGRNTNNKENTIAAFDKAIALGAQGVECDLRLTLDNKVVVHHNKKIAIDNKKVSVLNILFKDIVLYYKKQLHELLFLDELFVYIANHKHIQFFLEVKNSSKILTESIIKKIEEQDLWSRVYIIGFSFFIGNAVRMQSKYPKLKVWQLINIPLFSYIRNPSKSYGVMFGWFDSWRGSEWLFRRLISVRRLEKLREWYEKNGFKVVAGVINKKSGFKYFRQAGIEDIITDNVIGAVDYFKHR